MYLHYCDDRQKNIKSPFLLSSRTSSQRQFLKSERMLESRNEMLKKLLWHWNATDELVKQAIHTCLQDNLKCHFKVVFMKFGFLLEVNYYDGDALRKHTCYWGIVVSSYYLFIDCKCIAITLSWGVVKALRNHHYIIHSLKNIIEMLYLCKKGLVWNRALY